MLRAVLGDEQLTYIGWSYGTSIGTAYAEQFPENVRAMILDGAVDPERRPGDADDRPGCRVPAGLRRLSPPGAPSRRAASLGTDPAKATAVYQALVRPLLDKPLPLADGRVLSFDDAITGTRRRCTSTAYWPYAVQRRCSDLAQGRRRGPDGDRRLLRRPGCPGSLRQPAGRLRRHRLHRRLRRTDPAARSTSSREKYAEAAPYQDTVTRRGAIHDPCAFWPVDADHAAARARRSHGPAPGAGHLHHRTTRQPRTRPGSIWPKDLGAALLTVDGTNHTAYLGAGIKCVDSIGNDYLIHLDLPADGTTCP